MRLRIIVVDDEEVVRDVMFTDSRMPRMSGIEFIKRQIDAGCKGVTRNKAIMSASFTGDELEQIRRLECRCFMKPFRLTEMEEWVKEAPQNIDPDRRLRDL